MSDKPKRNWGFHSQWGEREMPIKHKLNNKLLLAVQEGDIEKLKKALLQGADVNCLADNGWSALLWAVHMGRHYVVEFLVERGAEINKRNKEDNTPLIWSAFWRRYETVRYLIDRGADISLRNKRGKTAVDYLLEQWENSSEREGILSLLRERYPEEVMTWHLDNGLKLGG